MQTEGRAEQDHAPLTTGAQRFIAGKRTMMGAREVDRDLCIPVGIVKILQLLGMARSAVCGIVNEDFEAAESLERGLDSVVHVFEAGHVAFHGQCFCPFCSHEARRLFTRRTTSRDDDNSGSGSGQFQGNAAPNPPACAGNQSGFARQAFVSR
ncbi:hypothetical protein AB7M30_002352 [Pseudomonas sp. F-14 TE3931]